MQPEAKRLDRVKWDYFSTLTWPARWVRKPAVSVVAKTFHAFMRDVACRLGVPYSKLLWCLRAEHGEITNRPHFHCLIAGKLTSVTEANRWAIRALWKKHSGAFADVRLFDRDSPGVGYVLKAGDVDGANRYEMGKFALDLSTVTLFRSIFAAIKGRIAADVRDAE